MATAEATLCLAQTWQKRRAAREKETVLVPFAATVAITAAILDAGIAFALVIHLLEARLPYPKHTLRQSTTVIVVIAHSH